MTEPTNFMESNALLSVQMGDCGHAQEILEQMLPNELRELYEAAEMLGRLARIARERKDPTMSYEDKVGGRR